MLFQTHIALPIALVLVACAHPPTPEETARSRVEVETAGQGGSPDGMVRIPGGTFTMGSDDSDSPDNEKPLTRVTLSPYYIDRTQVTVGEYRKCVAAGKCQAHTTVEIPELDLSPESISYFNSFCNWGKSGHDNHPINCVDWTQAKNFCSWRGARLPTEAEWEFAAKGTDGRKYPWGNQEPTSHLAKWNSNDGTAPVGSHPAGASPFGVQDMAGNVWEWVQDGYGTYPGGSVRDPKGPGSGAYRVLRGGGWYSLNAGRLRAAVRDGDRATNRDNFVGFRCARGADS